MHLGPSPTPQCEQLNSRSGDAPDVPLDVVPPVLVLASSATSAPPDVASLEAELSGGSPAPVELVVLLASLVPGEHPTSSDADSVADAQDPTQPIAPSVLRDRRRRKGRDGDRATVAGASSAG
jgi:hypothetical protein